VWQCLRACCYCCRHEEGLGIACERTTNSTELVGGEEVKRKQGLPWRHGLSRQERAQQQCSAVMQMALDAWSCRSEAGRQAVNKPSLRRRGNLLRVGLDSSTAREFIRGRPLRVRKSESLTGDGVGSHHHRQWYGWQTSPVERACRHHPCPPNDSKLNHPPELQGSHADDQQGERGLRACARNLPR